jgi:4-aminobutyrate--pyruvate transaminase
MIWYFNNAIGRPQKKKLIARIKGYHGVTVAAASLTGLPYNHKLFDLPIAGVLHTSNPHFYHEGREGESEQDFSTRMAAELEEMILREGPDTVAAMFAEPVMGAGGVIVPPAGYWEKIQAVLKKYDVLLVADEVICGFGRTGNYWGSETFGMQPDILVCAKALSSSYLPISAVMVNDRVFQGLADGSSSLGTWGHGFTYSGHPVPAAVALETLAIYKERDIVGHVRAMAPLLQSAAMRHSPDDPDGASALYVAAFQVGIMTGSVLGGTLFEFAGLTVMLATSALLIAAIAACVAAGRNLLVGTPGGV